MIWGLLFGAAFAVGDGLLLRWIVRRAAEKPERARGWLLRGMAARGCLTVAAVAVALLVPFMNAAGVIIALLVQKVVLAVLLYQKSGG